MIAQRKATSGDKLPPKSSILQEVTKLQQIVKHGEMLPRLVLVGGEESYWPEQVDELVTEHYIDPAERPTQFITHHGPEASWQDILAEISSGSLFGGKKLVLVRQAQDLKELASLISHAPQISSDTTLLLLYAGSLEREGKKVAAAVEQYGGLVLSSPQIRNKRDIITIANRVAKERGERIDSDAVMHLIDLVGYDGAKIAREIVKLSLMPHADGVITVQMVDFAVGMSREFNTYELLSAIVKRNHYEAHRIARHMAENEKRYPLPLMLATLYNFFANLMVVLYHCPNGSPNDVAALLGLRNSYAAEDFVTARWHYNAGKVFHILHQIRMTEARYKGAEGGDYEGGALLLDLVFFILSA